jgi:hypothetical protein
MSKDGEQGAGPPRLSAHGQQAEAQRRKREAAALRENLARRKAQQRARHAPPAAGSPATPASKSGGSDSRD